VRTVVFHRDFRGFRGGHLNVWHYFNHVRSCPDHAARICFSKETVWDENNPWLNLRDQAVDSWQSVRPDVLFLAGQDWAILDDDQRQRSPVPIINLIQHVQHALPNNPRYRFLQHRAIRICLSEEVAAAISETGQVNGPVFVIPNGIDLQELPNSVDRSEAAHHLVIAALKQPKLGSQLMERLRGSGQRIDLLTRYIPRPEFLRRIAQARVTLFLPNPTEGFYIPALEGMALGTLVVCPDCMGNRSFCLHGQNCLRPEYNVDAIVSAAEAALRLPAVEACRMLDNARQMVARHSLPAERKAFHDILQNVSQLW
jgi:hypothetical protein